MKNTKTVNENQHEESKSHFEKTQEGKKTEETNPNNIKASQNEQVETNTEIIKTDTSSSVKAAISPEEHEMKANEKGKKSVEKNKNA